MRALGRCKKSCTAVVLAIIVILSIGAIALAQAGEEQRSAPEGTVRSWSDSDLASPLPSPPQAGRVIPLGRLGPRRDRSSPRAGTTSPTIEQDQRIPASQPSAPNKFVSFEGVDNLDNSAQCGYIVRPPDPHIAAGPNHLVVVANVLIAIYSKSGTLLEIACLDKWFANVHPAGGVFDPRIAYDPHEGRWIVVALAVDDQGTTGESWYLLSVSQGSDPTGPWWNWRLNGLLNAPATDGDDTWADYPDLGFDGMSSASGGAIYITANNFKFSGNGYGWGTNVLNILPKAALYSGSAFDYWMAWGRRDALGWEAATLRAAHVLDSSSPEFLVNTVGTLGQVSLWRVNPTFPPTPVDWTLQATLTLGDYSWPTEAEQPGCAETLDTIDNRIYNAVVRHGKIYAAFTEGYDFGGGLVAAIRYFKADLTTDSVDLDVRFGADGVHHWFPAIAVDGSDNIVLVYARSSSSEFASIYYTGRKVTDSSTQLGAQLKAGEICITGFRWGDYFGAAVDPADEGRIWIYGEWAEDLPGVDTAWDWGTWIGEVGFVAPSPEPIFRVTRGGDVYADRAYFCGLSFGCFQSGTGADIAETIRVSEPVAPGDLVELDPRRPGHYRKTRRPYSTLAAGVISTAPGITIGGTEGNSPSAVLRLSLRVGEAGMSRAERSPLKMSIGSLTGGSPIWKLALRLQWRTIKGVLTELSAKRPLLALIGVVPVRASAENGPIRPGDLLASSSIPGHVMRCPDPERCEGAIVGKALEPLEEGTGLIKMLVMR